MAWDQDGEPTSTVQLGRYTLLATIAQGQFSTVYLARQQSDAGFTRLVALKRLLPELADQREYVELMQDEARIGAGLNHANLVPAIDVGGGRRECFVAFEYVEGDSLAGLLERPGAVRHPRFLAPMFVDALAGLHAAHTALAPDDRPMRLVHQAPHAGHILVGIDGFTRVADFGQVRSPWLRPNRLRTDRLRIGYMAPEQVLRPDVVDHRADLFIVGTTLWEALTGRRLFDSYSEEQSFQNLLHRTVQPPSAVNPSLPPCFDGLCLRALEREPEDRFESAAEMARELRDTAINHALFATATEVGQWVKSLCGTDLIARRRLAGSDSPSQQMRVEPLPSSSEHVLVAEPEPPFRGRTSALPPSGAFEDEVTTLHLAPAMAPDSDAVPVLIDEYGSGSALHSAPDFSVTEDSVTALHVPVHYDRKPDSGELPDFSDEVSDPCHDVVALGQEVPTRAFESSGLAADSAVFEQEPPTRTDHELPTRVMPAPSAVASAYVAESSRPPPPPSIEALSYEVTPTPSEGISLQPQAEHEPAQAISSGPPPRARRPDFREENLAHAERRDSTPARMRLSEGPVGDVFGTGQLRPPAPAPVPADLVAALAASRADGSESGPVPAAEPDTLMPPSQSHSLPPDDDYALPRKRGVGRMVAVGLLVSAAALGLAWALSRATPAEPAAASQADAIDDPDFLRTPDVASEPTTEAEPAPEGVQGAIAAPEPPEAASVDVEPGPEEQVAPPASEQQVRRARPARAPDAQGSSRRPPRAAGSRTSKTVAPGAAPVAREPIRQAPPPTIEPADEAPAAPSAPPLRRKDWRDRGQAIPDNPF